MARGRRDGAFSLVDPVGFRFLELLLGGETDISRRLKQDLQALRSEHESQLSIDWDDLATLNPSTPIGVEIRHQELIDPPVVKETLLPLNDVAGAIRFRQALIAVAARYQLTDQLLVHLHQYLRDDRMWHANTYGSTGVLRVALLAAVYEAGEEIDTTFSRENGVPYQTIKARDPFFEIFAINPMGDFSRLEQRLNAFSTTLKNKLAPYWKRRTRMRDPALVTYCAYLRDVAEMSALDVWKTALADAPGQWRGGVEQSGNDRTRRRKAMEYVRAGRRHLETLAMSE
jgi:hypothetical protein